VNVVLREEALADLRGIRDWYFERNPAVARTMIARVRDRLAQLAEFPEIGATELARAERTLFVPGTPLVAVYRIEAEFVDVIAIIDARRHPASRNRP
jgi:toxin ParE1/3/4